MMAVTASFGSFRHPAFNASLSVDGLYVEPLGEWKMLVGSVGRVCLT